jgi:hypothetical protein
VFHKNNHNSLTITFESLSRSHHKFAPLKRKEKLPYNETRTIDSYEQKTQWKHVTQNGMS